VNITEFGGPCQSSPGDSGLCGSVTSTDSAVQFRFTENGNKFTASGTLSGDGETLLNRTYTADPGKVCTADSGDRASATASETSSNITVQGTVQGEIVTYYGYYETVNNAPFIYLADATDPAAPNYVGTVPSRTGRTTGEPFFTCSNASGR